jgi:hypothetical protein
MSAYEAVRAHELMLNEAVSRFEHARLAPLIALNGGAVVAFLTLLGALLSKDSGRHPNLWLSGLAVAAWVVGLVAAALATTAATAQQRAISAAHRLLREELEDALINDSRVAKVLQGPAPTIKPPSSRPLADWAQSARRPMAGIRKWWTGLPSQKASGGRPEGSIGNGAPDDHPDRKELRNTGRIYGQRLKARWWLSVTMFVTGAALAMAAIVSVASVPKPTEKTATTTRAGDTQVRRPGTTGHAAPPGSGEYVMSCLRLIYDSAGSGGQAPAGRYHFSSLL